VGLNIEFKSNANSGNVDLCPDAISFPNNFFNGIHCTNISVITELPLPQRKQDPGESVAAFDNNM
jgi:hypothetical protein